jgi:hypothetical protein
MQVGPCIPVGRQLWKAESWPEFWTDTASFPGWAAAAAGPSYAYDSPAAPCHYQLSRRTLGLAAAAAARRLWGLFFV